MPWKLNYQQDTETPGVGTATATYTDNTGNVLVTHSDRIDSNNGNGMDQMIDTALEKLAKRQEQESQTNAVLAKIEAVLNERSK